MPDVNWDEDVEVPVAMPNEPGDAPAQSEP